MYKNHYLYIYALINKAEQASYKTKRDYWLFKQWSLLGTTILLEKEWIEILKHCKYKGDYYFTNAENLNLIQR